ncbi:uncharacterized protein EV422DRAFT_539466 [Fimicolochytrium jonesii]|uniref:uncharacterized protein n=1 Tax=Fimicolochytrium jonesii TaxID=1396493 RepID=UPI0022FEB17F|nr:uncharacterized protein EV422DRAFT_539466 [Fimicolochytrium jonesii]KAI8817966.1 hypothetical protein EV422DRAFT_539466 [Fimicolochytrium jonesii]
MYLLPAQTIHMPLPCPVSHDAARLAIGTFITVGMVVSYLPQFIKIFRKKSSEGLSLYFFFLGSLGMVATVANMALLQYPSIVCCRKSPQWTPLLCFENTLGFTQVAVQTACFMTCVILFYVYYPAHLKHHPDSTEPTLAYTRAKWIRRIIIAYTVTITATVVILLTRTTDAQGNSEPARYVAGVMGVGAAFTSVFQFMPQILHTWDLQAVGSLSIPMMLMQCPGSFLVTYSLYIAPGANWTSWLPYFMSGSLQGVLLALCIFFTLREGKHSPTRRESDGSRLGDAEEPAQENDGDDGRGDGEDSALGEEAPLLGQKAGSAATPRPRAPVVVVEDPGAAAERRGSYGAVEGS